MDKNKIGTLGAGKLYLSFLWMYMKKYRWRYVFGTIAVFLLNGLEMIPPIIFKYLADLPASDNARFPVLTLALCIFTAYLFVGLFRFSWRYFFMITSREIETQLKNDLFSNILKGPFHHVSKLKVGEVVSLLSQDISDFRMFMGPGFLITVDMLAYFIFVPLTLVYILGPISLVILVPLLSIAFFMPYYDKIVGKNYEESSKSVAQLSDHVYEDSLGVRVFRVLGLIGIRRSKFKNVLEELYGQRVKIGKIDIILGAIIDQSVFFSFILLLVVTYLALTKEYAYLAPFKLIGTLILTLQVLDKLVWPLMAIAWIAAQVEKSKASLYRLKPFLMLPEAENGEIKLENSIETIRLNRLNFTYPQLKDSCLQEIELEMRQGEKIGIVGSVGAGKTSLLRVLATLYPREAFSASSTYEINGTSFEKFDLHTVRAQISYIPQESVIFNNTIANNVCPYPVKDRLAIREALHRACLSEDMKAFPDGLNTAIGEKGVTLSGGQKQRIAIARSFYSNASLYLWDDAISALDIETERSVVKGIFDLNPKAILVLATHRPSALVHFDKILVLSEGHIVERGTYNQLISQAGEFYKLIEYEYKTRNMKKQTQSEEVRI